MKPRKHVAESGDYKFAKNAFSSPKKVKVSTLEDDQVFDLTEFSIQQLLTNLQKGIKEKPSWFIFMRTREHEKIKLNTEQIRLLVDQLGQLRIAHAASMRMKADVILIKETIQHLVDLDRLKFQHAIAEELEGHKTKVHEQKYQRKTKDLVVKKKLAQVKNKEAKTKINESISELIKNTPPDKIAEVLRPFFEKDKQYSTEKEFQEAMQKKQEREHEKELASIKKGIYKQEEETAKVKTAWDKHNITKKIKDDDGDINDYLQNETGKGDKV